MPFSGPIATVENHPFTSSDYELRWGHVGFIRLSRHLRLRNLLCYHYPFNFPTEQDSAMNQFGPRWYSKKTVKSLHLIVIA